MESSRSSTRGGAGQTSCDSFCKLDSLSPREPLPRRLRLSPVCSRRRIAIGARCNRTVASASSATVMSGWGVQSPVARTVLAKGTLIGLPMKFHPASSRFLSPCQPWILSEPGRQVLRPLGGCTLNLEYCRPNSSSARLCQRTSFPTVLSDFELWDGNLRQASFEIRRETPEGGFVPRIQR